MSILVTGGAGYIGSHVVRLLNLRGDDVVVLDDLSTGHGARISDVPLIRLDLSSDESVDLLQRSIERHRIDAVIHVAAQKQVGQSMERPTFYMRQNVGGMINLLDAMETTGVRRLVFSSSAAAYGAPNVAEIDENTECVPITTYSETKLIGEQMCDRSAAAWGLAAASLRYFNVAGAGWPDLGDPVALNLIPIVFDRLASGARPHVFGDDYPTPGRVLHPRLRARPRSRRGACPGPRPPRICRTPGVQHRHRSRVQRLRGHRRGRSCDWPGHDSRGRRATPGRPARLVGNAAKAAAELGWRANRELPEIIASAWAARQG